MVLKCADIGHLAADLRTHKRWAYLLEEEFFLQVSPTLEVLCLWAIFRQHCAAEIPHVSIQYSSEAAREGVSHELAQYAV